MSNAINIQCCFKCNSPLVMASFRRSICLKCNVGHSNIDVMCCYDCDQPLNIFYENAGYCMSCKFTPSMQDTYIQKDWFNNRNKKCSVFGCNNSVIVEQTGHCDFHTQKTPIYHNHVE